VVFTHTAVETSNLTQLITHVKIKTCETDIFVAIQQRNTAGNLEQFNKEILQVI
jgi:hypothetical protein